MGALVCDICGGKLIMGTGGVAVCDSCGMEYSKDAVKEKVQEIKGVVQIDNSNQLANWIRMGDNAMEAKNYSEAYSYYTKVIETDPNNWEATIKRGESAYWQGTMGDPRLNETVAAMKAAMAIVDKLSMPDEEAAKAKIDIFKRGFNMYNQYYMHIQMTLIQQKLDSLMNSYSRVNTDLYYTLTNVHKTRHELVLEYYPIIEKYDTPEAREYMDEMKSWRVSTLCDYCSFEEEDDFFYGPSANDKKTFIENYLIYLDELLQVKPDYMNGDNPSYPDPYDRPRNSAEYEKRKKELPEYWKRQQSTLATKKAEAAQKRRNEEYWENHQSEKNQFETRLKEIAKEKADLQKSVSSYDSKLKAVRDTQEHSIREAERELADLENRIADLENQKSKLGIFAGKQKKEMQSQIDSLKADIPNVKDKVQRQKSAIQNDASAKLEAIKAEQKPYADRLVALQNEENTIRNELNKNR